MLFKRDKNKIDKSDKWIQVCVCSCGAITKINNDQYQKCCGCKYFLSTVVGFSRQAKIVYAYEKEDGTWKFK